MVGADSATFKALPEEGTYEVSLQVRRLWRRCRDAVGWGSFARRSRPARRGVLECWPARLVPPLPTRMQGLPAELLAFTEKPTKDTATAATEHVLKWAANATGARVPGASPRARLLTGSSAPHGITLGSVLFG